MPDLLNPDDAVSRILEQIPVLSAEQIPLIDALDRVIAIKIVSDIDLPPFANSSMDGFAVRAVDTSDASEAAPVSLAVTMDIPAGASPVQRLEPGQAARVMTGAPLPEGADAVVPVEATDQNFRAGDAAPLPTHVSVFSSVGVGASVRPIGEDIQRGQTILEPGTLLRPPEIGVLAALGYGQPTVVRRPRVTIVSTGNELIDVDQPLAPGKIRESNSYTLSALVRHYGGEAIRIPVARDTIEDVRKCFLEALEANPDVVISSAGVSVGAFDVVRTVLDELGEIGFWRVNLRPGKPLAYGSLGPDRVPFFGLPGNPISAMVTFDVFVRPALMKMSGRPDSLPTVRAVVDESIPADGRRTYFRVKLNLEADGWHARLTGTQSSGALMSMVLADGLLIVPEGVHSVPAGTPLSVRLLRDL
ncbi:MAG: molybdopterin molybdotransferase MoeA [Chloroflexi bacterium]|nr:molybdopterin molybdotransferase MoeA [Chloroflexota bacterium]